MLPRHFAGDFGNLSDVTPAVALFFRHPRVKPEDDGVCGTLLHSRILCLASAWPSGRRPFAGWHFR